MPRSVVTDTGGEGPARVDIGEIQGASELAFEGGATVCGRVTFEETRGGFDFVSCCADLDRRTQQ